MMAGRRLVVALVGDAKSGVLIYDGGRFVGNVAAWGIGMAKKAKKKAAKPRRVRAWTKEDVRMLKALAREKVKTSVIARKLKRTERATYQKALALGVALGGGRGGKRA